MNLMGRVFRKLSGIIDTINVKQSTKINKTFKLEVAIKDEKIIQIGFTPH